MTHCKNCKAELVKYELVFGSQILASPDWRCTLIEPLEIV